MAGLANHSGWLVLNRHCSDWLKGIAILLMLAHHLFGLPSLIEPGNAYAPMIPGMALEYWIGRFGKICVSVFLLLSGYGFATRMMAAGLPDWRYFLGKAWRFMLAYWPYFLLAFVIGSVFFQERMANGNWRFPVDPAGIALNAVTLQNTMAFEWWFAETYLLLVLLTRPLLLASNRPIWLLAGSFVGFVAGAAMDVARFDPTVISFANLLIWQLPWVMGIVAATAPVPDWARPMLGRKPAFAALLFAAGSCGVVERFVPAAMTPVLIILTPFVVHGVACIWGRARNAITTLLAWLGRKALGLWLVHPFLCYYFFQDWIYAAHFAPLVFAALLGASLVIVLGVEGARQILGRFWRRCTGG